VKWPLAFRLLPPDQERDLTGKLEGQLLSLASNPAVVQDAKQTVQRLHRWLKEHRNDMADATYRDGLDFLRSLDTTLTGLAYAN
jgi:hypothetical protein